MKITSIALFTLGLSTAALALPAAVQHDGSLEVSSAVEDTQAYKMTTDETENREDRPRPPHHRPPPHPPHHKPRPPPPPPHHGGKPKPPPPPPHHGGKPKPPPHGGDKGKPKPPPHGPPHAE